jgi:hypothetical protein
VNWDAVSLPGVGSQPYPVIITVAPTSQHRDESFQSIAQLLTNEDQTRSPPTSPPFTNMSMNNKIDLDGEDK